ncbi:hypothetical protein Emag_007195 [Eimeria magna]
MRTRVGWGAPWPPPPLCLAFFAAAAAVVAFFQSAPTSGEAAAAAAATKEIAASPRLSDTVEPPCSCGGGKGEPTGEPVAAAHPQPPADVSGLSREGVYFIPEPLPAHELQEGCEAEERGLPSCPPGGPPQGWGQPSSYTASLVFTPGGAQKIAAEAKEGSPAAAAAAAAAAAREDEEELSEQQCILEGPLRPAAVSFEEHMDSAFAAAWRDVRDAVDSSEIKAKRDASSPSAHQSKSLKAEGPCLRGRAPTVQERRRLFLSEFGSDYSLEAERTAQRELKRLKGDIYLDYAGKQSNPQRQALIMTTRLPHSAGRRVLGVVWGFGGIFF